MIILKNLLFFFYYFEIDDRQIICFSIISQLMLQIILRLLYQNQSKIYFISNEVFNEVSKLIIYIK